MQMTVLRVPDDRCQAQFLGYAMVIIDLKSRLVIDDGWTDRTGNAGPETLAWKQRSGDSAFLTDQRSHYPRRPWGW